MSAIVRANDDRIDQLEATMVANFAPVECPLTHRFTKGMYIREIFMPAGALVTSKIHKTEHPFTISKGKVKVCIDAGEWVEYTAPYTGITNPGTRRVLFIIEDCIWTTYHARKEITGRENDFTEISKNLIAERIEKKIIKKHDNILLKKEQPCLL